MPQQGLVYIEFTGIARLFFKKLFFFEYNLFLLFCTGSPLYFCEFLLIIYSYYLFVQAPCAFIALIPRPVMLFGYNWLAYASHTLASEDLWV